MIVVVLVAKRLESKIATRIPKMHSRLCPHYQSRSRCGGLCGLCIGIGFDLIWFLDKSRRIGRWDWKLLYVERATIWWRQWGSEAVWLCVGNEKRFGDQGMFLEGLGKEKKGEIWLIKQVAISQSSNNQLLSSEFVLLIPSFPPFLSFSLASQPLVSYARCCSTWSTSNNSMSQYRDQNAMLWDLICRQVIALVVCVLDRLEERE